MTSIDTLKEIFSKPQFEIPIQFSSDDFKNEVSKLLTSYINELENNNVNADVIATIKSFRSSCSYVLSNYFKGMHYNAYENFIKALKALKLNDVPFFITQMTNDILFRGRVNYGDDDYSPDEMYHIPLDGRGIVSSQRYSFPGLPCLYLGASAYTCWVELNRPRFDDFQLATVMPNTDTEKMNIIDLSNIPQQLDTLAKKTEFNADDYFRYWPLLALCSIQVKHENDAFKPEYIFPQFLLEYILSTKNDDEVAGIKYASIKSSKINSKCLECTPCTYVNYVFPSRSSETKGKKCPVLDGKFRVGRTYSGKELRILTRMLEIDPARYEGRDIDEQMSDDDIIRKKLENVKLCTSDGKRYSYQSSYFGMIELALQKKKYD